ncbi:MAG: P22 phage major capsid protein family protein [Microthrixaceae bacterium]
MAHSLWTPTQAARYVLAALRWQSTLPRTVHQDISQEFVPGRGTTINVRKPVSAGTANTYTPTNRTARDAITFDDLSDSVVPVVLANQVYKAVRLPDDFATFTLEDITAQVLKPQAESVVDALTAPLVTEMVAIAGVTGTEVAVDGSDALKVVGRCRKVLNDRKVPMADRWLAVGTELAEDLLNLKELTAVNESGSDGALREGTIGRLRGFTVLEDPALPEDQGVAYHRDAFAHVTRPSRNPEGATRSATIAEGGFALRWLQHYNPLQLEDQSVVDTFVGAKTLDATRAVGITKASS